MIRTGTVFKASNFRQAEEKKPKITFAGILFLLFLVGMVYGAALVATGSDSLLTKLSFITDGFIGQRGTQGILKTFQSSFYSSASLLVVLFLLGFFALGQPAALFVPVFRGLGIGFSMGYFYLSHGLKGVAFCILMILPHAAVSTMAIVVGAKESFRMSNVFLHLVFPKIGGEPGEKTLKLYAGKFMVLMVFALIAAGVDCLFTVLFARFFSFA